MLAELTSAGDHRRTSGVTLARQRIGQGLGLSGWRSVGFSHSCAAAFFEGVDTLSSEALNGISSAVRGQVPKRGRGEVVVGVRKSVATGVGQRKKTSGPPPAALAADRAIPTLDRTYGDEGIEMPTHRRGGKTQLPSKIGGRGRAVFQQQPHDAVAGADVEGAHLPGGWRHGFHNNSVSYFLIHDKVGPRRRPGYGARVPANTYLSDDEIQALMGRMAAVDVGEWNLPDVERVLSEPGWSAVRDESGSLWVGRDGESAGVILPALGIGQ